MAEVTSLAQKRASKTASKASAKKNKPVVAEQEETLPEPTLASETPDGQAYLEGQEPVVLPDIEAAGKTYHDRVRVRLAAANKEAEAYQLLDALMKKHEIEEYHSPHMDISPPTIGKHKVTLVQTKDQSTAATKDRHGVTVKGSGRRKNPVEDEY